MKRMVLVFMAAALMAASRADVMMTFEAGDDLSGWTTSGYDPAVFEIAAFDGDSRLHMGLGGSAFEYYKGKQYATNLSGDVQSFSIDLYVDSGWGETETGMWGVGYAGAVNTSYATLAFRKSSSGAAGFFVLDYETYEWVNETPISAFDTWYNLEIVLTVGRGFEYFVNGGSIGSVADTTTASLGEVMLNALDFGAEQDIYWDNFKGCVAVPAPAAVVLAGMGVSVVGWLRRRKSI